MVVPSIILVVQLFVGSIMYESVKEMPTHDACVKAADETVKKYYADPNHRGKLVVQCMEKEKPKT